MACVQPATRSLGYVFLDYVTNTPSIPRRARLRLTYPIAPDDLATIGAEAALWAAAVANCIPTNAAVLGWGTMNPDGTVHHLEAFLSPHIGSHASATNAKDVRSLTVTFTGQGDPVTAGQCAGNVRHVLYVGSAFWPNAGQKAISSGADGDLDDLRDFITGNSVLGADYYGNVGNYRSPYPVQYNAHAQRKIGT